MNTTTLYKILNILIHPRLSVVDKSNGEINNVVNIGGYRYYSFLVNSSGLATTFLCEVSVQLMLTSLLRTARKQPLLSSEGSNMKKGSFC